jgi:predicted O-methyltransferase YrrM
LQNLAKLFVVMVRVSIYCIFNPRKIRQLLFSFYASINDFYQVSHGKLYDFNDSKVAKYLKKELLFAKSNHFYKDANVTRSVETQIFSTLTAYLKPKKVFEIGTYNGFTTAHFACNTEDTAVIYTMDLPQGFGTERASKKDLEKYSYDDLLVVELSQKNIENRIFHKHSSGKKVVELFGDSKTYDFSKYYGKIDLIFIDGNHSYEYVKSDTENAFKMLSENGVIVWHDYDYIIHRDVFKYLNKLVEDYKIYSIPNTRFAIYGPKL